MATTNTFYNKFREVVAEDVNLSTDTFKLGLTTNSYSPNLTTHTVIGDITNEVSGSGYARQTLASVSWAVSGTTATFSFAPVTFTASGGSIVARRFFVYDDTTSSDWLVCTGLLDSADADVTITDGQTLTITVPVDGFFRFVAP